jgi:hypothetical protein
MIYIVINGFAILAAGIVSIVTALLWYRKRPSVPVFVILFLATTWLAAILAGALILAPAKGSVWTMTIGSAVVIWAGFVVPALVASYRLRNLRYRVIVTDCGYWLTTMIAQAVVMRLIGLTPPPGA